MTIVRSVFVALLVSTGASPAVAAAPLADLASVEDALDDGRTVSVVLDLGRCTPASAATKPTQTRGGVRIDAYRVTEDGTLAFADDHFTVDRDGTPIRQFLRYRVHRDGTAEFSMAVFSLPDFHPRGPTLSYACTLNQGLRFVMAG